MLVEKIAVYHHFTNQPFLLDRHRKYPVLEANMFKPSGLWLTDEKQYGWKKWCDDNCFGRQDVCYRVELKKDNILFLTTVKHILQFSKEYRCVGSTHMLNVMSLDAIDWTAVKKKYHGIMISPYQARLNPDILWYNTWDCASGVVWNLDSIKKFTQTQHQPPDQSLATSPQL